MIDFHPAALMERLDERWRLSEEPDFGRDGIFELVHDDADSVILAVIPALNSAPRLAFYASVGWISGERSLRRALERMDFWTGLEGPSLGLRAATGELTITEIAPLTEAQIDVLPALLDDFVAALHALRAEFESLEQEASPLHTGLEA